MHLAAVDGEYDSYHPQANQELISGQTKVNVLWKLNSFLSAFGRGHPSAIRKGRETVGGNLGCLIQHRGIKFVESIRSGLYLGTRVKCPRLLGLGGTSHCHPWPQQFPHGILSEWRETRSALTSLSERQPTWKRQHSCRHAPDKALARNTTA